MTLTIYGIVNCDTMKKARGWLEANEVEHELHDYRKDGIKPELIEAWVDAVGWEALLNRAGTTFRKLPDAEKAGLDDARATALMLAQPAMIRRPVLVHDGGIEIGFKADRYAALLGS